MKYENTLGLIGQGISASLSPWIHNAAAQALGLPHRYQLFELEPHAVEPFLQEFWAEGGVGLNVTKPYKRVVARSVQSPLAAANTLYRSSESSYWQIQSTDGVGFLEALHLLGGAEAYPRWVFLSNGGAVASLLDTVHGLPYQPQVFVLRRDSQKDEELAGIYPGVHFLPFTPPSLKEVFSLGPCLLVQASTASPETWTPFLDVLDGFSGACMDLAYGQHCSELFLALQAQRHPCEDGLAMLLEHARFAQKIWWGRMPSRQALLAAMTEMAPQYGTQWNEFKHHLQRILSTPIDPSESQS